MYYDRREVKLAAKAAIRETRPKPIWITLAYLMMVSLVGFIASLALMVPYFIFISNISSRSIRTQDAMALIAGTPLLLIFFMILLMLYVMVMQYGLCSYSINVKRRLPSGFRNLFSGFSRVGRVLMLNLLTGVFTFLWSMLGWVALFILFFIAALLGAPILTFIFSIVGYVGFFAFLMNRTLRYAPALLIMVDHPELTAREALNESKEIMRGNVWNLFVFELSFIGWNLLVGLIAYVIIFLGIFLSGFMANFYMNPESAVISFLLICIVAFVVTAFLSMWVIAYQSVAFVGFYDAINGFDGPTATPMDSVSPTVPTMTPPQFKSPEPSPDPEPAQSPQAPAQPEASDKPVEDSEIDAPEL